MYFTNLPLKGVIIIIVLVVASVYFYNDMVNNMSNNVVNPSGGLENFYDNAVCPDCNYSGWRRKDYCQSCLNCGWSVGFDGFGQCVPGYKNGPVTNLNTKEWYYGGKHIWQNSSHPRHAVNPTNETQSASVGRTYSPRLDYIPFWRLSHKNRMRNDYGDLRYGRRFGYGWDPRYEEQRY